MLFATMQVIRHKLDNPRLDSRAQHQDCLNPLQKRGSHVGFLPLAAMKVQLEGQYHLVGVQGGVTCEAV